MSGLLKAIAQLAHVAQPQGGDSSQVPPSGTSSRQGRSPQRFCHTCAEKDSKEISKRLQKHFYVPFIIIICLSFEYFFFFVISFLGLTHLELGAPVVKLCLLEVVPGGVILAS